MPTEREHFIDLANRIRDENDRGLSQIPVAIGGHLFVTHVENWSIRTVLWHSFPDLADHWSAIVRAVKEENAQLENEETG